MDANHGVGRREGIVTFVRWAIGIGALVLCVGFIALWVFSCFDGLLVTTTDDGFETMTWHGRTRVAVRTSHLEIVRPWRFDPIGFSPLAASQWRAQPPFELGFRQGYIVIAFEHWFAILLCLLATYLAVKSTGRFTTRTLLVATTVAAVLLAGMAVSCRLPRG
jgi:hypothetical protein